MRLRPSLTWRLLAVLLCLQLAACASLEPAWNKEDLSQRSATELQEVPFYPQEDFQCGPAALAMVLDWGGSMIGPEALTRALYIPARKGSLQPELVAQARRQQRLVYPIQGELSALLDELQAGHPVLVLQNLALNWWPAWHYAVAIGFDPARAEILLHSGTIERHRTALPTFMRTWARSGYWGLVVLQPGELPASAQPGPYLAAAFDLEASGFQEAAELAYQAGIARWPEHAGLWIALANRHYARGQTDLAASTLRQGTTKGAASGALYHNLALLLADLGEWQEAQAAAQQALNFPDAPSAAGQSAQDIIRQRQPQK